MRKNYRKYSKKVLTNRVFMCYYPIRGGQVFLTQTLVHHQRKRGDTIFETSLKVDGWVLG